jgi:hypothetical protein
MRGLRKDWAKTLQEPKVGDLKVWWIPQVPMKPFEVPVPNLLTGKHLMDALAEYDFFQLENRIKPDFSNAGGLMMYEGEDEGWCDWYNDDGEEIDQLSTEQTIKEDRARAEKIEKEIRHQSRIGS